MTLEEFMKHAADAAYMGDADLLEGYAREVFDERDAAREELARVLALYEKLRDGASRSIARPNLDET